MNRFWEVVYDDSKKKMEIIGTSSDDTLFTHNISEMQRAGMKVHCQTSNISIPKEKITLTGYNHQTGLYSQLLENYENLSGKQLKRW